MIQESLREVRRQRQRRHQLLLEAERASIGDETSADDDSGHLFHLNTCYSSKTLLAAKGIATKSKDATRGSWPYY